MQVGTKERKPGSFGGCLSVSEEEEGGSVPVAYLARPGLRMWTADETGKVYTRTLLNSLATFFSTCTVHYRSHTVYTYSIYMYIYCDMPS